MGKDAKKRASRNGGLAEIAESNGEVLLTLRVKAPPLSKLQNPDFPGHCEINHMTNRQRIALEMLFLAYDREYGHTGNVIVSRGAAMRRILDLVADAAGVP